MLNSWNPVRFPRTNGRGGTPPKWGPAPPTRRSRINGVPGLALVVTTGTLVAVMVAVLVVATTPQSSGQTSGMSATTMPAFVVTTPAAIVRTEPQTQRVPVPTLLLASLVAIPNEIAAAPRFTSDAPGRRGTSHGEPASGGPDRRLHLSLHLGRRGDVAGTRRRDRGRSRRGARRPSRRRRTRRSRRPIRRLNVTQRAERLRR